MPQIINSVFIKKLYDDIESFTAQVIQYANFLRDLQLLLLQPEN